MMLLEQDPQKGLKIIMMQTFYNRAFSLNMHYINTYCPQCFKSNTDWSTMEKLTLLGSSFSSEP